MGWKRGLSRVGRERFADPTKSSQSERVEVEAHDPRQASDYVGDYEVRCAGKCRRPTPHLVRRGEKVEIRKCLACGKATDVWLDELDQAPPLLRQLKPGGAVHDDLKEPGRRRVPKTTKDEATNPMELVVRPIVEKILDERGLTGGSTVTTNDVRKILAGGFKKLSETFEEYAAEDTGGGNSNGKGGAGGACTGDDSCTRMRGRHKNGCPKPKVPVESAEA